MFQKNDKFYALKSIAVKNQNVAELDLRMQGLRQWAGGCRDFHPKIRDISAAGEYAEGLNFSERKCNSLIYFFPPVSVNPPHGLPTTPVRELGKRGKKWFWPPAPEMACSSENDAGLLAARGQRFVPLSQHISSPQNGLPQTEPFRELRLRIFGANHAKRSNGGPSASPLVPHNLHMGFPIGSKSPNWEFLSRRWRRLHRGSFW